MLSSIRRSSTLAMLAALAFAGGAAPVLATQPAIVSAAPRPVRASKRSLVGGIRASIGGYGRKGAGISMAQQQRAANKKRNVARNRRHHR